MRKNKIISLLVVFFCMLLFQNCSNIGLNAVLLSKTSNASTSSNQPCSNEFSGGFDILVVAGQSNAVGSGRGEVFENPAYEEDEVLNNICQISRDSGYGSPINIIDAGRQELQHVLYNNDGHHGFAYSFAKRYSKNILNSNRKLLIIPVAKGSTSILAWDNIVQELSHVSDSAFLYRNMVSKTQKALNQNSRNRIIGVFWQQGEADIMTMSGGSKWKPEGAPTDSESYFDFHANLYQDRLVKLHRNLTQRFCGDSENLCFAFIIGQPVHEWAEWITASRTRDIRDAKDEIKRIQQRFVSDKNSPAVKLVTTQHIESNADLDDGEGGHGDNYHFSSEGLRLLGHRYYLKYLDYLNE